MKACKIFFIALVVMLAAAGAANAQLNGVPSKGEVGLDSGSQAAQGPYPSTPFYLYGSGSLDAPRTNQNSGAGSGGTYLESVNLGWPAESAASFSMQTSPLPLIASTSSQATSEMSADTNSQGPSGSAPASPRSSEPSDQGFHVAFTPYLWFAGLHGTVGALGQQASVHASFGDIFSYLNLGLMFAVEPRYNRIVMPLDFMWMKLSDDKALPVNEVASSVKVKVNQDMLAQKIGYRVIDSERLKVDGLVGIRYWHMGNTLTLQPAVGNGLYASADWVDAVAGAKFQAMLTPKLVLTILGDAGAGGANTDYQVAGLIGWKLKKFTLQGGWRYLSVNYRPTGGFVYDMNTSGLIFGATIPLK